MKRAVAPLVVSRTDLICTAMHASVAPFAENLGVRLLDAPLPFPEIALHLIWHERNEHDGGHAWLRETLRAGFAA